MDMKQTTTQEAKMRKLYRIECGSYSETWNDLEGAKFHAKRVGLARCEEARVLFNGKVVYEF